MNPNVLYVTIKQNLVQGYFDWINVLYLNQYLLISTKVAKQI